MSFYSALLGYDTRQAGMKQGGASHYLIKAIVMAKADLYFESTSSFMQVSVFYGVTEVQFYALDEDPVILIQVDTYYQFDQQLCIHETLYFHSQQQLQLTQDPQMFTFVRGSRYLDVQIVVSAVPLQKIVRFPLVELNVPDFQLSSSKYFFSNFVALEVYAGQVKFLKHFNGRQGDLSAVCIPFVEEILFKMVFVIKILETYHRFALVNAKIHPQYGVSKSAFLAITDFNAQLDYRILKLIDNIIFTLQKGKDEWEDQSGVSVKLNLILTPGFLNRWIASLSPKIVELDLPQFSHPPHVASSENKKLQKVIYTEFVACDDVTRSTAKVSLPPIKGSIFVHLESSFIPKELHHSAYFAELQKNYKSVALLAVVVAPASQGFGFAVLSNKELYQQKLAQEFEVGSGNLSVCKPTDTKDFLVAVHRENPAAVIKLLVNNTKSLIKTSANGITIHCLIYEKGCDFVKKVVVFTQQMLESGVKEGKCYYDMQLTYLSSLRLYFYDLVYQEKNGIAEPPKLVIEPSDGFVERSVVPNMSVGSFTKYSLVSALDFTTYQHYKLEYKKVADYFGGRIGTFFIVYPRHSLRTFYDSLDEERRKIEEELRRIAEEKRRLYEELQRYEQERRKAEEERLRAERYAALLEQNYKQEENLSATNDGKAFRDNRRREMDEKRRKMQEEKRVREEAEKEELRRKMELKKLRNLKWQQQIQRFIVKDRGYIDTFYNDKMDYYERSAKHRELQYPKKEVRTLIIPQRQPETFYVCATGDSTQGTPIPRLGERCRSEVRTVRQCTPQFDTAQPISQETPPECSQMLDLDSMRTKYLLIQPIACLRKRSPVRARDMLENLYSSPLARSSKSCAKLAK